MKKIHLIDEQVQIYMLNVILYWNFEHQFNHTLQRHQAEFLVQQSIFAKLTIKHSFYLFERHVQTVIFLKGAFYKL